MYAEIASSLTGTLLTLTERPHIVAIGNRLYSGGLFAATFSSEGVRRMSKKVILKVNTFLHSADELLNIRKRVIDELNNDNVAIVPPWVDVYIVDDNEVNE